MKKRFISVIKYHNFLRTNRSAPLKVKTKVLQSCVMSGLLHNCEAFGSQLPKHIETTYMKLLRSCFNVRSNVPNYILLIESGFLPIKSIVLLRQYNFYKRFRKTIEAGSRREKMMQMLLGKKTSYLKHYEELVSKYATGTDIITEGLSEIKQKIYRLADAGHYKYQIYVKINPDLTPSPFLSIVHPLAIDAIRFRVGSHYLPIETGRWCRKLRHERVCTNCGVLGDENHVLYHCALIHRDDIVLDGISKLWYQPEIYRLVTRLKEAKYL